MASDLQVSEGDPHRVALILPGRGYTADMPLLWYARTVLSFQGWTVHSLDWPADAALEQIPEIARSAIDRVSGERSAGADPAAAPTSCLIIGKSLGSLALPIAVERALPGIWLTPLLFEPTVAAAAERLGTGHLLIGGTADRQAWDPDRAHRSAAQLLEIPGADHTLQVAQDLDRTLAALERVVYAINAFALEITQSSASPRS